MAKITYSIEGIKGLEKKFSKFGEEGVQNVKDITQIKALDITADAKARAPIDTGKLRQGIIQRKVDDLTYDVIGTERYSPYIEFGTGDLVSIPPELKDVASLFRGSGRRKVNIPPQPYLYPAFKQNVSQYIKDLQTAFKRLTKKYSK